MKYIYMILLLGGIQLGFQQARAQLVIDGTNFSNFGYVSNNGTYTEVTSTTGSLYESSFGAIFDHSESDANTLRVNNPYNANGTGGSIDNFNGPLGAAGVQGVSGSVAPNFSTLVIKNGATSLFNITNTAGANVFTTADFQNGITTTVRANTDVGALRFEDGATYTGGNTDAQHVDGYVSKIGDDAFTFPVGSGTDSRALTISAPASATTLLTTAYDATNVENATSVLGPIISVFTLGSWDWITGAPADDDNLAVTVSMPDMTAFASATNLRLVGWNGTQWIDLSGSVTASGVTEGSTLSGTIPPGVTITQIGIGTLSSPLPVTLTEFTAEKGENQTSILNWSTTAETNSDRFEVERSSNGKVWATLAPVKAIGESKELYRYTYTDMKPVNGANLYRLKMIDNDATFAYSRIRSINFERSGERTMLYPNPVVEKLTLDVDDVGAIVRVELTDLTGKLVYDQVKSSFVETLSAIDMKHLTSGIYLVRVTRNDGTVVSLKVVKQ